MPMGSRVRELADDCGVLQPRDSELFKRVPILDYKASGIIRVPSKEDSP